MTEGGVFQYVQSSKLSIKSVSSNEVGFYACEVKNIGGSVESRKTSLTLKAKIKKAPTSQQVGQGQPATFRVEATGTDLQYQWLKDGEPLSDNENINGATKSELTIREATSEFEGNYVCIVRNSSSEDASERAILEIGEPI